MFIKDEAEVASRVSGVKCGVVYLVSQLEFNVPFQHKYGYIRDDVYLVKLLFESNE